MTGIWTPPGVDGIATPRDPRTGVEKNLPRGIYLIDFTTATRGGDFGKELAEAGYGLDDYVLAFQTLIRVSSHSRDEHRICFHHGQIVPYDNVPGRSSKDGIIRNCASWFAKDLLKEQYGMGGVNHMTPNLLHIALDEVVQCDERSFNPVVIVEGNKRARVLEEKAIGVFDIRVKGHALYTLPAE